MLVSTQWLREMSGHCAFFRYAVSGATGKEVIIFDLYPGTGEMRPASAKYF